MSHPFAIVVPVLMDFINTNPVWDDWDLVYMPEESYDEAHEEICAILKETINEGDLYR